MVIKPPSRKARLIGVPFDLGASKRGSAGGPAAIRRTNLLAELRSMGLPAEDWGDVDVPPAESSKEGSKRLRYADAVYKVCKGLEAAASSARLAGWTPVTLGGDHSVAMGSISGVSRALRERRKKLGVIWVDAHGDMNTPATSASGNIHGMPLAHMLGLGERRFASLGYPGAKVDAKNVCLVGLRDLDDQEKKVIRSAGVHVFTMKEIDLRGMAKVTAQALELATEGTGGLHVSFDIDSVEPSIAPGVGTPKRGGLTYREAHLFMELVADSGHLVSLDMAEVNPLEDVQNVTAELAGELIQSALGKSIY